MAAPEFSVEAREWCYPLVGCVAYRGYFVERRARTFAHKLRRRGFDVSVAGVAAYSTLGHFNDPILNTMVGWSDVALASIIFHELTHQLIYVPNDADFNEALATTVEEVGVRRWLQAQGREKDLANYELEQRHDEEVVRLLIRTRAELRELYASGVEHSLHARAQGCRVRGAARFVCEAQVRVGRSCPLRGLVRGRPQQCPPGLRRDLFRLCAGVQARTRGGGRKSRRRFIKECMHCRASIKRGATPCCAASAKRQPDRERTAAMVVPRSHRRCAHDRPWTGLPQLDRGSSGRCLPAHRDIAWRMPPSSGGAA